jgi:hypothetical protein
MEKLMGVFNGVQIQEVVAYWIIIGCLWTGHVQLSAMLYFCGWGILEFRKKEFSKCGRESSGTMLPPKFPYELSGNSSGNEVNLK